jgi:Glycosyl hydrolase family 26
MRKSNHAVGIDARAAVARLLCTVAMVFSLTAQAGPSLGVYRWEVPSNVDGFSQWLGRPVEIASDFTPRKSWSDIEGPDWQLGQWSQWVRAKSGRNFSYAVALFPSGGSLASCAAGQYDAHWRNLANNLASYGLHWAYLRLGWEMQGGSRPWAAPAGSGKEASFAGCFRRVVQVMRQAQPANQWKFVFNPTVDGGKSAWLESVWPGNAYVDVVGVDHYDQCWATNTYPYPSPCDAACRLKRQQTAWSFFASQLDVLRNFAIAHGKPMAFPEWGVATRSDGHGGGDNPYFIQKMHDFIVDPASNVVFQAYFNVSNGSAGFDARLSGSTVYDNPTGPTRFPNSAALFKQLFAAP